MKKPIYWGLLMLLIMTSFTASEDLAKNPLLQKWDTKHQTPPFELIKAEHYVPAIDYALEVAKKEVDAIINNSEKATFENTIVALETAGELLDRVTSVMFNLNSSHTSPEIQAAAREVSPKLSEFYSYISLDDKLFARIKAIYDQKEGLNLDAESLRLLENSYLGFVRSGANLNAEDKKRFAEISTEMSKLTLNFGENVLAETNAYSKLITDEKEISGLPAHVKEAAAYLAKQKEKEGWLFNLQAPSFFPILRFADSRELREEIYRQYSSRAFKDNEHNNSDNIKKIVALRLESANLLGFETYSDYVLDRRMAETPERVNNFLSDLHEASRPMALKEFEEVTKFAQELGFKGELERWDWSYYTEKLKNEKYGFKEEEIKPYFQLETVQKGIFDLANTLWGITLVENKEIQVYHEDVTAYEVFDADGTFLSVLYTDFFPRESKRGGAWSSSFRSQSNINGNEIRPFKTIVCNFTKPTETKPSLLSFGEVTTFLHEFGHAVHGMFANTIYPSMSGTSVYWDFVELPSQIMENWAVEKEWLDTFVAHYETGEKIPEDLISKLLASKNFLAGSASERQLSLGMNDMAWHTITAPVTEDIEVFEDRAMQPTSVFKALEGSVTSTAFSHIFAGGYASGYYSYKWAEVLDADAFSLFKETGIFNKETAAKFRKLLESGGTEHPMDLYVKFRGHEPTVEALLERSGLK
jgi:peptidyl-dipeptidase Dcp